jgi:hypothetical protein
LTWGIPCRAAYLHPFAVIDNDEPGSAVQIVMQGIPLTPMKAQNIGSIVGNGSGRVIEDGYTRLSIAQFTKTDGTRCAVTVTSSKTERVIRRRKASQQGSINPALNKRMADDASMRARGVMARSSIAIRHD